MTRRTVSIPARNSRTRTVRLLDQRAKASPRPRLCS
jgi:hypothetical protein